MLLMLAGGVASALVSFLVVLVVLGGLMYILKALPIDQTYKTIGSVVIAIILFIMVIKILLPLVGI